MATSWLSNKNSKRWKQLEYVLNYMPHEFSNKDMMNFLEYRWGTEGPKNRAGRILKQHHFNRSNITRFLIIHENIETCEFKIDNTNVYRKRNKNAMDRKI